ncbi:MAG: hypothetical protein NT069_34005 [Planctomycetota bacterium]|nr:hypothetical protein [Planctomycetota bacterium]
MTRVDFTTCRTTALIVMVTVLSCRAFAGRPQVEDLSPVAASSEIPRVDYLRDVKPLLEKRCFACHGALAQKGALRLDTGTLVRIGGGGGQWERGCA